MSKELKHPNEKDMEKNRFLGIVEGGAARIIFNLTSGAFLVGLLKYMGASDAVCGYIIAIPVLAAVIQFLSPVILESLPYRKRFIVICSMIHKFLLTALIFIPFLPLPIGVKLVITAAMFFVAFLSISFVTPAISNMYVSFVPQNIRGRYFGTRESYILIASTVITLILGKILDVFTDTGNEVMGYIVVYIVVLMLTLVDWYSYLSMKEIPLVHTRERLKIKEIFSIPFKDKRFIKYFIMLIIWNVSFQIAGAYFSVYLKSDLEMNYTTITILSMVQSLIYILTARMWGKFADKKGWSYTTLLTIGILAICHITWFFMTKGSPFIMILLVAGHITGGIAWSGINVALFNMQFDYTPNDKRTVYIGLSAATGGIIGYAAAVFGSYLVGLFGRNKIAFLGSYFDIKQILFLVSSILLLICTLYIEIFMKPRKNSNEEENNV